MIAATKHRNVHTFRGGAYVVSLMSEFNKSEIGARVASQREETGLKQREVAELMNVTPRTVQYWESEIVPFDRLDELARVIGTTKFWLLHGDDLPETAAFADVVRRLAALEAKVDLSGVATTASLESLVKETQSLKRRLSPRDGKATAG